MRKSEKSFHEMLMEEAKRSMESVASSLSTVEAIERRVRLLVEGANAEDIDHLAYAMSCCASARSDLAIVVSDMSDEDMDEDLPPMGSSKVSTKTGN